MWFASRRDATMQRYFQMEPRATCPHGFVVVSESTTKVSVCASPSMVPRSRSTMAARDSPAPSACRVPNHEPPTWFNRGHKHSSCT